MKNLIIFMFSIVLFGGCGSEPAETVQYNKYEVLIENSCGFDKDVINKKVYAFASDIDADNALEKIMKLTGLPPNFEIKAANVDNACAVVECDDNRGCKRLIYYNQEFIEKMNDATNTDFTELAILAHEIGHHLSGHTIAEPKNRHEEELEADKFAGFILHQLGASIETTKNVFSYVPEDGSKTHPPKAARIAAISNGWYGSKRKGNTNSVKIIESSEISIDKLLKIDPKFLVKLKERKNADLLRIIEYNIDIKNIDFNSSIICWFQESGEYSRRVLKSIDSLSNLSSNFPKVEIIFADKNPVTGFFKGLKNKYSYQIEEFARFYDALGWYKDTPAIYIIKNGELKGSFHQNGNRDNRQFDYYGRVGASSFNVKEFLKLINSN